MSTLYTINAHVSTSAAAGDFVPVYKTADGSTKKVSVAALTGAGGLWAAFGATATAQPASTTAVASTSAVSVSATQWGFSTSTQADGIVTLLRDIHANLVSLGLKAS